MRTLVVSDLHLANRSGRDVLALPAIRQRLLAAIDDADVERLVLLGDTIELMHHQPRRSMVMAEPVLRALGQGLGPDREVVVVPGNHDAALIRDGPWPRGHGSRPRMRCRRRPARDWTASCRGWRRRGRG